MEFIGGRLRRIRESVQQWSDRRRKERVARKYKEMVSELLMGLAAMTQIKRAILDVRAEERE